MAQRRNDDAACARGPAATGSRAEERPRVSVVVPFHGTPDEAWDLAAGLAALAIEPGDELIVSDNTIAGVFARAAATEGVRVVTARGELSPAHARNVGAEAAVNPWLVFIDADCAPDPDLIDAYFAEPIPGAAGAVAGRIDSSDDQALLARYARSRRLLDQKTNLTHPYRPFAVTANLLVRREVWDELGGFYEGVRAGEDNDFCWRMQSAGWRLLYRESATVRHRHRARMGSFLRQQLGYGAGRAWINRHHPGSEPRPRLVARLSRCIVGVGVWTATLRFERAAFKAIDALLISAEGLGYLRENRPRQCDPRAERAKTVVLVDGFPSGDHVARELRRLSDRGVTLRVEAANRGARQDRSLGQAIRVAYREDDGIAHRLQDLAVLWLRHPLRCAQETVHRRRLSDRDPRMWEIAPTARRLMRDRAPDVYACSAQSAAVAARAARLAGVPGAADAHARDVPAGAQAGT